MYCIFEWLKLDKQNEKLFAHYKCNSKFEKYLGYKFQNIALVYLKTFLNIIIKLNNKMAEKRKVDTVKTLVYFYHPKK